MSIVCPFFLWVEARSFELGKKFVVRGSVMADTAGVRDRVVGSTEGTYIEM